MIKIWEQRCAMQVLIYWVLDEEDVRSQRDIGENLLQTK